MLDVVLLDVALFDTMTIRIRAFTVQTAVGRTKDPAEARLFLRMFDDGDSHVAWKYAAFVSTATLERAHDLVRLDEHPLSGVIVLTSSFLWSLASSRKSFCDILS